jgi:uncharacterized protein (TIGR03083 family)
LPQEGSAQSCQGAHNPKVAGSNPAPATIETAGQEAPDFESGAFLAPGTDAAARRSHPGDRPRLADFAELVRSLDEHEYLRPSRCRGWTARDVAAHLIGAFADITSGRIEGQGTPEVSERQVGEREGRSVARLAHECDAVREATRAMLATFDDATWALPAQGSYDMTLGQAMESMWCGAYVHADDIRAAIGRRSERGPGLRASVHHVADRLSAKGWGPAILALDGLEEIPVGTTIDTPKARRITGDPLTFLLAATRRTSPAPFGLDVSVNVFA